MKKELYGYMRVSTADQNEIRQRIELEKWGIHSKNIYMDKQSGKNFNRPEYRKMISQLKHGDLLVVKSIDRLGRNYRAIQEEWRIITKDIGADIVILDMPLLDTRSDKDLLGTLITDIVLQLLSYVAETERQHIRQRQAEGIAAAKAQGKHLGRKAQPIPDHFYPVYKLWKRKIISIEKAAVKLQVTTNQFKWMVRKHQRKG